MRGEVQSLHLWIHRLYNFNPLAPCGARLITANCPVKIALFQSTRPMRGEVLTDFCSLCYLKISIHSPHAGRGIKTFPQARIVFVFQSTRPMRGEVIQEIEYNTNLSISIHSPHAGRGIQTSVNTARQA